MSNTLASIWILDTLTLCAVIYYSLLIYSKRIPGQSRVKMTYIKILILLVFSMLLTVQGFHISNKEHEAYYGPSTAQLLNDVMSHRQSSLFRDDNK